jgi:hypothetical protein
LYFLNLSPAATLPCVQAVFDNAELNLSSIFLLSSSRFAPNSQDFHLCGSLGIVVTPVKMLVSLLPERHLVSVLCLFVVAFFLLTSCCSFSSFFLYVFWCLLIMSVSVCCDIVQLLFADLICSFPLFSFFVFLACGIVVAGEFRNETGCGVERTS